MPLVRVEFQYLDSAGNGRPDNDDMWVPLSLSKSKVIDVVREGTSTVERVGPWVSIENPFEGELDEAEIKRLTSRRPVHTHWEFSVSPIETGGKD